jgi:predicted N-formylglutamate amidohydrolase
VSSEAALHAYSGEDLVAELMPGTHRSVFLTCEHASNQLPSRIVSISVDERAVIDDHWGWDIGALGLSRVISSLNGYPLVAAGLSRLVCDLNRPLEAADLHRPECDGVQLNFNVGLNAQETEARHEIHRIFHQFTADTMEAYQPESLVSIHSFTPVWRGTPREVEVGVLFNQYQDSAECLRNRLVDRGVVARLNEPYSGFADGVYSIERHGRTLSKPYLEIEVRQDLISSESGQQEWGTLLAEVLASDIFS